MMMIINNITMIMINKNEMMMMVKKIIKVLARELPSVIKSSGSDQINTIKSLDLIIDLQSGPLLRPKYRLRQ